MKIGDRVKYSRDFLRSTGQFTGPIPFARGIIQEISLVGNTLKLATVVWDNDILEEIPKRVNIKNLAGEKKLEVER